MIEHPTHAGRVAVVTGAARGLGQAIAAGLARHGADIVAVDLDEAEQTSAQVHAAGRRALSVRADVSDPVQVSRVAAAIDEQFGRADILVNNAALLAVGGFDTLDIDQWRRVMAVNVDALFLMTRAVVPLMRRQSWGRVVNLTSNTIAMAVPDRTAYITSKAAVVGFTRSLATDLAPDGITVNAVGPTLTATPGAEAGVDKQSYAQVAALQAIKRRARPQDLLGPVLFLTGDAAGFVTGQTIMADGGLVRL